MEQLTKNQAVATSQEAVQNQNEPQLRDENAHNDKSVHGVRSEERFSRNAETDLVCRLLLEKKNLLVRAVPEALEPSLMVLVEPIELVDEGAPRLLEVSVHG